MLIEFITLGVYFVMLLVLGLVFSKFNQNTDDYIRGGAKATWWMVGSSSIMTNISAFTFTGNAGAAFDAGPSLLVIFLANCLGYLVYTIYLAACFRQTRAQTYIDVISDRFGEAPGQFATYVSLFLSPLGGAIQLWALAVFTGAVFGISLPATIMIVGSMVVIYSTIGGKWAVMATDFAQSVVLFSITLLIAYLSIREIGGLDVFFGYFTDPRFAESFKFIKAPEQYAFGRFSLKWMLVIGSIQFLGLMSLGSAPQFLAAKDGNEAKKAALLGLVLMIIGSLVWFVPPMVARFLYEADVLSLMTDDPKTAAYAVIADKLLPNGLMGIMVAAIFSSTMSSLDTGLNGQTGIIVRNLLPKLRRKFNWRTPSEKSEVRLCRAITLTLGITIIGISMLLTRQDRFDLFDAFLFIASAISFPMAFPLIFGLWIKKIPRWGYFYILGMASIPSVWSLLDEKLHDNPWSVQDRFLAVTIVSIIALLVSLPFYKNSPASYRASVHHFFKKMRTPVDYGAEIGLSTDIRQASIMGNTSLILGILILFLLFVPNDLGGRLCVIWISGFCIAVGGALRFGVRIEKRKEEREGTSASTDEGT